ncbi:hypothetical protein E1A91_D03G024100v1 [Gossypium mustelinum]|uniref:Uncharacterized protein n=2 Tax=Gossypium TaxID=3633 RepID=A0A5D2VHU2_GOSMU|nr:hypothetical protein ES332_D03G026300v1 [Gossypium tomentosum]TYI89011.1 hypothetical protein E1A91_D03G024100v1 [Gossypium mustelinum]
MFGKHLRRAHLVQALKKKWFLPKKRRIKEWEVTKKFNWVELAERELKIERVIGIKRFVRSNEGRERFRGRVNEGWEKGLFGRIRKQSHCCKI